VWGPPSLFFFLTSLSLNRIFLRQPTPVSRFLEDVLFKQIRHFMQWTFFCVWVFWCFHFLNGRFPFPLSTTTFFLDRTILRRYMISPASMFPPLLFHRSSVCGILSFRNFPKKVWRRKIPPFPLSGGCGCPPKSSFFFGGFHRYSFGPTVTAGVSFLSST